MYIKPIDVIVTAGTSVTIIIPELILTDKCIFTLDFCLTRAELARFKTATGTEPVFIRNGIAGSDFIVEDYAGDILYANKLLLGFKYRIRYGNNGPIDETGTGGLQHYININTPCCSRSIDPANATVEAETEA